MSAGIDYSPWTELLAAIVTPDGKVDYEVLAPRRDLLTRFVAALGAERAARNGLPFLMESADVRGLAGEAGDNLEQAARRASHLRGETGQK